MIDKDGNVGINDTAPDRKVSIIGDSTSEGQYPLSLDATNTDYTLEFRRNGTSQWWIKQSGSSFNIHENGVSDHFRILAGGNVGIGDTNPDQKLVVKDGNIKLKSNNDGNKGILMLYDAAGNQSGQVYPSAGDLRIWSPNDVLILPAGNVGIGTDSPLRGFDVSNSISIFGSGGYTELMLRGRDGTRRNLGAWHLAVRGDYGGSNDNLKFLRWTGSGTTLAGIAMALSNAEDTLMVGPDASCTDLNVLAGTPKIQIGSGTGHASLQFYSGTTSVNGIYFGDTSSAVNQRYSGYIEYRHNDDTMAFRTSDRSVMTLKSTGPLLPAGNFGYHTTQEYYTASTNPTSFSTASNITYTSSTQYWPDQGEKQICVINARAYTKYIHIKTNLTANNIMFMFRTKGYFYATGVEEQLIGGYTYQNSVISKSNETVAGNTHTGDTYRASDGSLVLKMHVNQTGYTEGKMLVFFHAHAPSTTSGLTVTAVTQKDDGTNAF